MAQRPGMLSRVKDFLKSIAPGAVNVAAGGLPVLAEQLDRADRDDASPGRFGSSRTIEIPPPSADGLRLSYAPDPDGDPDAGEIVWTWVPYAEQDGRGKDRPMLVIGRAGHERVFAVKLTSKAHDGEREFVAIGSGPWDSRGRPSWVDVDQLYSIHTGGMRREASALDLDRFARVADALRRRYGWSAGS